MGMSSSRRLMLCACFGTLAVSPLAFSQLTHNWRGFDGDWSHPANWNPTGVPNTGAAAFIGGSQPILIEYYEVSALRNFQVTNPNAHMYMYAGSISHRYTNEPGSQEWHFSGSITVGFDSTFNLGELISGGSSIDFWMDQPTSRLTLEPGSVMNVGRFSPLITFGPVELQSTDGDFGARLNAGTLISLSRVHIDEGAIINASLTAFADTFTGSGYLYAGNIPLDCQGVPWTTFSPDALPATTGHFRVGLASYCKAEYECDLRADGVSDRLTFVTNQSQVQLRVLPQLQGVTPTLGMSWHIIDIANATANNRNITIAQNAPLPNPRWGIRPRFNATTIDAVVACNADYNIDGVADFFDYLDFVADFAAARSGSDFNADFVVDFFDYLDFVAAFADGC